MLKDEVDFREIGTDAFVLQDEVDFTEVGECRSTDSFVLKDEVDFREIGVRSIFVS